MWSRIAVRALLALNGPALFGLLHQQTWYLASYRQWFDQLGLKSATELLDVGCGPGGLARVTKERGIKSLGVDSSVSMLRQARKINRDNPLARFAVGNAYGLKYPDNYFDAVVSASLINIAAHPQNILCEMGRVVKPGGRLSFLIPDAGMQLHSVEQYLVGQGLRGIPAELLRLWASRAPKMPPDRARALAEESGWRNVSMESLWQGRLLAVSGNKAC